MFATTRCHLRQAKSVRVVLLLRNHASKASFSSRKQSYPHRPEDLRRASPPDEWVSDVLGVLSVQQRSAINARLRRLNRATGVEVAIVCVEDLHYENTSYRTFTEGIMDCWGVGNRGINDGIVLSLFREGRRVEIVTGSGVKDVVDDAFVEHVNRRIMVPEFKKGNHGSGLALGVKAIADRVDGSDLDKSIGTGSSFGGGGGGSSSSSVTNFSSGYGGGGSGGSGGSRSSGASNFGGTMFGALFGAGVLFGFFKLVERWKRQETQKRRVCERCVGHGVTVVMNVESLCSGSEDFLSDCGKLEIALGTAKVENLVCPTCDARRTSRVDRTRGWNADTFGYSSCRKCGCLAATETKEVLSSATTASEGYEQVTHWCEHCQYQCSQIVTIPKLEKTENSGGGFSGGSSSGSGGGGASW